MLRKALVIVIIVVLFGCSSDKKTDIGFLGTLSGRYAELGQDSLKGVLMGIDDSGAGNRINLVVADDKSSPKQAVIGLAAFKKSGIKYVIGPNTSTVAVAVAPLLSGLDMYMLSPTASTKELAGKNDNFVRVIPFDSPQQAESITSSIRSRLKINNMVIIYDSKNISYSAPLVNSISDAFSFRGGHVLDKRPFNPENSILINLVRQDTKNPPQMYYIIASPLDSAMLIWQIKKLGIKSKIILRSWAVTSDFLKLAGSAADGTEYFSYSVDITRPEFISFKKSYFKKYGTDPSMPALNGYECGLIMGHALDTFKSGDSFLEALSYAATQSKVTSSINFDDFGDSFTPLKLFMIKNGTPHAVDEN